MEETHNLHICYFTDYPYTTDNIANYIYIYIIYIYIYYQYIII